MCVHLLLAIAFVVVCASAHGDEYRSEGKPPVFVSVGVENEYPVFNGLSVDIPTIHSEFRFNLPWRLYLGVDWFTGGDDRFTSDPNDRIDLRVGVEQELFWGFLLDVYVLYTDFAPLWKRDNESSFPIGDVWSPGLQVSRPIVFQEGDVVVTPYVIAAHFREMNGDGHKASWQGHVGLDLFVDLGQYLEASVNTEVLYDTGYGTFTKEIETPTGVFEYTAPLHDNGWVGSLLVEICAKGPRPWGVKVKFCPAGGVHHAWGIDTDRAPFDLRSKMKWEPHGSVRIEFVFGGHK